LLVRHGGSIHLLYPFSLAWRVSDIPKWLEGRFFLKDWPCPARQQPTTRGSAATQQQPLSNSKSQKGLCPFWQSLLSGRLVHQATTTVEDILRAPLNLATNLIDSSLALFKQKLPLLGKLTAERLTLLGCKEPGKHTSNQSA
jgi:hypothetical protein